MTLLEIGLLGLMMVALIGLGITLGAAIMWRLVHRTEPPPPPLWVNAVHVASWVMFAIPLAIAEQWLLLVATSGLSLLTLATGIESERRRRSGRAPTSD